MPHADYRLCQETRPDPTRLTRHEGIEGFLITAYPTDKVKEGEIIWTK